MAITATATGGPIMVMGVAGATETGLAQELLRVEIEAGGDLGKIAFRHRISPLAERNPACLRLCGPGFFYVCKVQEASRRT
jgi:hypothetical protein